MHVELDSPSQPDEFLTDDVLIGILLEKVKNKHTLLTISLSGVENEFSSIIVDLDESGKHLDIDSLKPEIGNTALGKTTPINIRAKLKGISLSFKTHIIKCIDNNRAQGYRIKFPESIKYQERRISHRASVARGLQIKAEIHFENKQTVTLDVLDLSLEGIGLICNKENAEKFSDQLPLCSCDISFHDKTKLTCDIELCRLQKDDESTYLNVGARFVGLSPRQENLLLRQLRFLDRENIRKTL